MPWSHMVDVNKVGVNRQEPVDIDEVTLRKSRHDSRGTFTHMRDQIPLFNNKLATV